jgi:plasmid stabilization system protein ParE
MRVELRVEARRDLTAAAEFYDRQREKLGDYFLDCLFSDLEKLKSEAGIHQITYGLHCKPSKRFPFAIYYRVGPDVIDVVAILDCRQNPREIQRRLE